MSGRDISRPPTTSEIAEWKRVFESDDRRYDVLTNFVGGKTWYCDGHFVEYNGPPWWLVVCVCAEPKPCFHMAEVARAATEMAASAAEIRERPANVLAFPGPKRGPL